MSTRNFLDNSMISKKSEIPANSCRMLFNLTFFFQVREKNFSDISISETIYLKITITDSI